MMIVDYQRTGHGGSQWYIIRNHNAPCEWTNNCYMSSKFVMILVLLRPTGMFLLFML